MPKAARNVNPIANLNDVATLPYLDAARSMPRQLLESGVIENRAVPYDKSNDSIPGNPHYSGLAPVASAFTVCSCS